MSDLLCVSQAFFMERLFHKVTSGMFADLHTTLGVLVAGMNKGRHFEGGLRKYCSAPQTLLHFLLIYCPLRGNVSPAPVVGAFAICPYKDIVEAVPSFFLPPDCLFSKNTFRSHFPFTSAITMSGISL